jgi:hypothetical protein
MAHADELLAKYPNIAAQWPRKNDMSVYKKLMDARKELRQTSMKKSGVNKFAGYSYFELADFLTPIMDIFDKLGLCGVVSFTGDIASLTITDIESKESLVITSPMGSAALKGCHEVQNIGAVETYQRRYLWVAAMEIVEHDALDSSPGPVDTKPVLKHSPTAGIFELLEPARKAVISDCADAMRERWAADDLMGAYEIALDITDAEEKTALWDQLKPDSKLRAALKKHGDSLKNETSKA